MDWRTDRPEKEGEYLVTLEMPVWENCNSLSLPDDYDTPMPDIVKERPWIREVGIRYFGDVKGWRMYGEPEEGNVWTEQTGSTFYERVVAWAELPEAYQG